MQVASKKFEIEPRYYVYFALLLVAIIIYTASLTALYDSHDRKEFWKTVGLFFGPTLVAIGWVVTNEINIRNSRKQHTITLILQYFTNADRVKDKAILHRELPAPTVLHAGKFDHDTELMSAVLRELNYFDYLASLILRRDIEEALMRRVFGSVVRRHYTQLLPYIEYCRKLDSDYWEDFMLLHERWKKQS